MEKHIERFQIVPDIDSKVVQLTVHGSKGAAGSSFKAIVTAKGKKVASAEGSVGESVEIAIPNPQLWSPESPFLYDLDVSLQPSPSTRQARLPFLKNLPQEICCTY